MRVVVTRPAEEAGRWLTALRQAGHEAIALPLIDIAAFDAGDAPAQVWRSLQSWRALMFVSGNAVAHFFAARPPGLTWNAHAPRAWAPGPGTARALQHAGVAPACIDQPPLHAGQFDSEALWPVVQGQLRPGDSVLVVRGADASGQSAGRDWLAAQVAAGGGSVQTLAVYQRQCPAWDEGRRALAAGCAGEGCVWLFSSSEAVSNLTRLLPGHDWSFTRALATHERIAAAARAAGFGVVQASRPAQEAVLAALESAA